ncbi:MAG: transcription factor S [Methanobrevibacter sp.]|uniref:transcription factor S n=1 Tax=Methanobrevibacter sp. TaxID=66852 RepID=UPI0026E07474|nr:transcription factor S [Methanobrevibacter sp.]MDO5848624.1 transcription factor S [Methanobrevibacter sp.]
MEFCPECGGILLPNGDKITCGTCGYEKDLAGKEDNYKQKEEIQAKETIIMKGEDINTLPTTTVECPKCGHDKAAWWLQQTRSADEAETRFLKCLECSHTWREYD